MWETESGTAPYMQGLTARYPPGGRVPEIIREQVVIRGKKERRENGSSGASFWTFFPQDPIPISKIYLKLYILLLYIIYIYMCEKGEAELLS